MPRIIDGKAGWLPIFLLVGWIAVPAQADTLSGTFETPMFRQTVAAGK